METPKRPLLFTLWGLYFFITGFASLVGSIALWHFGDSLPWVALCYTGMGFLLGRAFFLQTRWILPLLTLHVVAYSALFLAAWLLGGEVDLLRVGISTTLAIGAWGIVYLYRSTLREEELWTGILYLMVWILVFTNTAAVVLQ